MQSHSLSLTRGKVNWILTGSGDQAQGARERGIAKYNGFGKGERYLEKKANAVADDRVQVLLRKCVELQQQVQAEKRERVREQQLTAAQEEELQILRRALEENISVSQGKQHTRQLQVAHEISAVAFEHATSDGCEGPILDLETTRPAQTWPGAADQPTGSQVHAGRECEGGEQTLGHSPDLLLPMARVSITTQERVVILFCGDSSARPPSPIHSSDRVLTCGHGVFSDLRGEAAGRQPCRACRCRGASAFVEGQGCRASRENQVSGLAMLQSVSRSTTRRSVISSVLPFGSRPADRACVARSRRGDE